MFVGLTIIVGLQILCPPHVIKLVTFTPHPFIIKLVSIIYMQRHLNNPVDVYTKKLYSVLPKSTRTSKKRQKKKQTYAEELQQHTASVK